MGNGGNETSAQKPGSAGGNLLRDWFSSLTEVFAYGWTLAIPLIAFLWTIVILIYSLSLPSGVRWGVFATAVITGSCSFLAGGLVGLLFGIPRSALGSAGTTATGRYQANSNLVEVSDWLTKIIVGVGLVQIGRLEPALSRLAEGTARRTADERGLRHGPGNRERAARLPLLLSVGSIPAPARSGTLRRFRR